MKSMCILVIVCCCLAGAFAASECEKHRERELNSKIKARLIPKCDSNGDYEALQCFEGSNFCMCWRKDGSHITDPSVALRNCKCYVHRDKELAKSRKGLLGNFVPDCTNSGTYAKKQCSGSTGYCWCSDEDGNRIGEEVRGDINCST